MRKFMQIIVGIILLALPALGCAHLIDEVAESIVVSIDSEDRTDFQIQLAFHKTRLERYHVQAEQLGLLQARTDAAFIRRLHRSFSVVGCSWAMPASVNVRQELGRNKFVAYRLRARCQSPQETLTFRREDHDRAKTRTTLYITTKLGEQPPKRHLMPPRLAAIALPLTDASAKALPIENETSEGKAFTSPTPGQPLRERVLPSTSKDDIPGWLVPPPLGLVRLWIEAGASHLLKGADHLALIFVLVVLGGGLRSLTGRVLAFSLGHLLTMALTMAAQLSTHLLSELAVALTVVWAGVRLFTDNRDRPAPSWVAMVICGCVHGVAFGGELYALMGSADGLLWPM
ncbi:MAG TPA: hypothetical protein DCQ06_05060, partial [Myxococcales bacterium]|nr:hypothetical protein [Myxococcales bacterium]